MSRPTCPRCHSGLDEGPVVFRCAHCRRAVPAADLDTEFHTPLSVMSAGVIR